MKMNDVFPSRYLTSEDCDPAIMVTVKKVTIEEVGQKKDRRPIVFFHEVEKGLVANKTNFAAIAKASGHDDTDRWNGTKVQLIKSETNFAGEIVPCIRVKIPQASNNEISFVQQQQIFAQAKKTGTLVEALYAFMKDEMQVESIKSLTEKQWADLFECMEMGVVMEWWAGRQYRSSVSGPDAGDGDNIG
jgi:hypothetical protein